MILIVDMNYKKDSLGFDEFVLPLISIAEKLDNCVVKHFSEITPDELRSCDKAVLSGTSLQDHETLRQVEKFNWVKIWGKPILGICAGMQVISAVYGGSIVPCPVIGLEKIEIVKDSPLLGESRCIEGYHLHNYAVTLPEGFMLLAGSIDAVEAFSHRSNPTYGIVFHPEVRSRWILERFANL